MIYFLNRVGVESMNSKNSKKALSEIWRETVIDDLKDNKKLKVDLAAVDPLEFIPDGTTKSLVKVTTLLIRSRGVVKTARATGVPRSSLYSVMDPESNPTLDTVSKILESVGYQLAIIPADKKVKK